jgi:hypothetical protein
MHPLHKVRVLTDLDLKEMAPTKGSNIRAKARARTNRPPLPCLCPFEV